MIRAWKFFLIALCFSAVRAFAADQPKPYLLHLPGIGGHRNIDDYLTSGIRLGGLDASIEIYDWTCNNPGLISLTALDRNHHEAQLIAEHLTQIYRAHPDQRIILSGHSGGAGVAIWSLEDLPQDVHVDTLVMLASALSPQYDLTKALSHVSGKAYVFVSPLDPILGLGTRNFGTIDRVYTDAAGRVGFTMPKTADAQQYAKLVSIPYNPAWMRWGNSGDHIGEMMRPFAQNCICPLLLSGTLPIIVPTTQP
jgi:pimeloyl-ACP methyl ester carboxylesterase